jgi:MFS family permease
MQSLASKFAKVHQRGLVLGIFTSAGYVGTFLGGLLGGAFYQSASMENLVVVIAGVCILWAILIVTMPNPAKKKFVYLNLDEYHLQNSSKLTNEAIEEWYINNTENIIAIKYDSDKISADEVKNLLK